MITDWQSQLVTVVAEVLTETARQHVAEHDVLAMVRVTGEAVIVRWEYPGVPLETKLRIAAGAVLRELISQKFARESICDQCKGTGRDPFFPGECLNCKGTGRVPWPVT